MSTNAQYESMRLEIACLTRDRDEARAEVERLRAAHDEARTAARWLLPFTINTPHTQTAVERWPWLAEEGE